MKQKNLLFILLLLLSIIVSGCDSSTTHAITDTPQPLPAGWRMYSVSDFSFMMPEGWDYVDVDKNGIQPLVDMLNKINSDWSRDIVTNVSTSDAQKMLRFWAMDARPAAAGHATVNIGFQSIPGLGTSTDMCPTIQSGYAQAGMEITDLQCGLEINQLDVVKLVGRVRTGAISTIGVQYFYIKGQDNWVMSLVVDEPQWGQYQTDFQKIAESFRVNRSATKINPDLAIAMGVIVLILVLGIIIGSVVKRNQAKKDYRMQSGEKLKEEVQNQPVPNPSSPEGDSTTDWSKIIVPAKTEPLVSVPAPATGYKYVKVKDTSHTTIVSKWASAFAKIGGSVSGLIGLLVVLNYPPNPGHHLPVNMVIGSFLSVFASSILTGCLGGLIGHFVWKIRYARGRSFPVWNQAPVQKSGLKGTERRKWIFTVGLVAGIAIIMYLLMTLNPDLSIFRRLISGEATPASSALAPKASGTMSLATGQPGQANGICWTFELRNYAGTRFQVWEEVLDSGTKERLQYNQYLVDVVSYNPQLKDDGYGFVRGKTYILPELCP
jgi:hypothetical protein